MSVNLSRHKDALQAAWKDVLDDNTKTDWALFSYDGQSNDLKTVSKGDGGIEELLEDLNTGKIMYAFLKIDDPKTSLSKYVLVNWQGEGAPTVRKGTCANHLREVSDFFKGHHLTFNARTEDEMDPQVIIDKVAKAGSAYSFKAPRSDTSAERTPVGTVYKKVVPEREINAKERDQFWIKEEEEEKRRVAEEKLRREQERLKGEEEIRIRDAREATDRENLAEKRNEAIARRKAAEHSQELARRREEDHNETQRMLKEQEESASKTGMSASETLRRQRSREAKELIGHTTSQVRAIFQQNSSDGQMNNKNFVPQKPIRNSVVAQRINSLTQQNDTNTPLSPTNTHSPPAEFSNGQPKNSSVKNIDKIKFSLESPSQIQQSIQIDPAISDLSPSEVNPIQFTSISPCNETGTGYGKSPSHSVPLNPEVKSNVVESEVYDTSSNNDDDEDSDNKFSTIKRSPHSKNNISEGSLDDKDQDQDPDQDLSRQNTVVENINYKGDEQTNGNGTPEDVSPETLEDDGVYQDLEDSGLTARALYDYQAADESEITFDPGDIITHIDQIDQGWWQGLGPQGVFGLFPANYVELLPTIKPKN